MKKWITILCCLCVCYAVSAQPVKQMEYFFDKDPGTGKGKAIAIATADTIRINVPSLSTAGLTEGMHALYVRAKTDSGWSYTENFPFYIKANSNAPALTTTEYFYKTDPGPGKATALNITPSADTITKSFHVPIPCLDADSVYNLYVRVKDEQGNWSHFETDTFKVRNINTVITVKAGVWSDIGTWSNNKVPDANTEIILNHNVTVDINATCKYLYTFCHTVNVNNGKTLIVTGTLK